MRISSNLVLLFLVTAQPVWAQVLIDQDTTWAASDSPIEILEETSLAAGVRLTVEPGVTVVLAEGVDLVVEGELVARGTIDEPITFTGAPGEPDAAWWGSVVFGDSASDAVFEEVDDFVSGSILEYCRFEHATRALILDGASPYVHGCTFENNWFEYASVPTGGAAIQVKPGSAPRIRGCTFRDNTATSAGEGGAIHIDGADPVIQDNVFEGNQSGYGGALTSYNYHGPVVGNSFTGNNAAWEGGAVALVSSIPAFLNNKVTENETFMDGAGVHVCTTCYPHACPLVMDNVIFDNVSGLDGGAGLGAAYIRVFSHNDVYGNLTAEKPGDFAWFCETAKGYPDWLCQPDISHNWWGTTDTGAIAETIHDGSDDPAYCEVTYLPLAEGPIAEPRTRATVTTLKLRYTGEGEPMPVYLTVYNPGPAREVDLMLLVQGGSSPPVPFMGELDFEGVEVGDGLFRLALPENAVFFSILMQPEFSKPAGLDEGAWHAALFEPDTGERIGQVISIRTSYGEGAH